MSRETGYSPEQERVDKPIFGQLIESHSSEADPEKAAYDTLLARLEPNMDDTQKLDKMREFVAEYRRYQEAHKE